MPIQVACPNCKSLLQVPDNLAGKQGKCRCGQVLTVPASSPAFDGASSQGKSSRVATGPTVKANPIVASLLDQVTESDMKLKAVVAKVEAPPTKKSEVALLKSFTKADDFKAPDVDVNARPKSTIVLGVLGLLIAFGSIAGGIALMASEEARQRTLGDAPSGLATVVAVVQILYGGLMLVAAVGLFTRIAALWYAAATIWAFRFADQVGWVIASHVLARDPNMTVTYIRVAIPLVFGFAILATLHSQRVRKWFGVRMKPNMAVGVTAGIGLVVGLGIPLIMVLILKQ